MVPVEPGTDDVRTAPPALRPLQLACLALLVGYFWVGFSLSLTRMPAWVMFGNWQMFTLINPSGSELVGELQRGPDEPWESVDLGELFPSMWGSGYRFSRGSFKRSKSRMRVLSASTCHRLEDTPYQVRLVEVRWAKVLGSLERRNEKRTVKYTHRCDRRVKLPLGRSLPIERKPQ